MRMQWYAMLANETLEGKEGARQRTARYVRHSTRDYGSGDRSPGANVSVKWDLFVVLCKQDRQLTMSTASLRQAKL